MIFYSRHRDIHRLDRPTSRDGRLDDLGDENLEQIVTSAKL